MPGGSKKGGGLEVGSAYKMKGSPMQRNFGITSPLKDKKEYGPYSYSHNTKEATDSHYGNPHGPKPGSEKKSTKTTAHETTHEEIKSKATKKVAKKKVATKK